jgi:hypothetical protein
VVASTTVPEGRLRRFPWTRTYEELLEAVRGVLDPVGGAFEMNYDAVLVTAQTR